jgi:hypothetical protein
MSCLAEERRESKTVSSFLRALLTHSLGSLCAEGEGLSRRLPEDVGSPPELAPCIRRLPATYTVVANDLLRTQQATNNWANERLYLASGLVDLHQCDPCPF